VYFSVDVGISYFSYDCFMKTMHAQDRSGDTDESRESSGNRTTKKTKKAILWGPDDLLTRSMELFLTNAESWETIRISVEQGYACLLEQARQIKPHVIILYAEHCIEDPNLPLQLIQHQPNLKVVVVSLEGNQMQVYSKHSLLVHRASDLLSIMEKDYFPDHSTSKGGE
jgi:hypothetical protein